MRQSLSQGEAWCILRAIEALAEIGAYADEFKIGLKKKFICYAFGCGFGVSYGGVTKEHYDTLTDFAEAYKLTRM